MLSGYNTELRKAAVNVAERVDTNNYEEVQAAIAVEVNRLYPKLKPLMEKYSNWGEVLNPSRARKQLRQQIKGYIRG